MTEPFERPEKDYYLDFSWLIKQKQWKAYENFLEDEINKRVLSFKNDSEADLKTLQIETRIIERMKGMVYEQVEEREGK